MAEPVLDVSDIPAGIHEVDGDRVSKDVRVLSLPRDAGGGGVLPEERVDHRGRHRQASALPARKQVWILILPALAEVGPHQPTRRRVDGVLARHTTLEAGNPDAAASQVKIPPDPDRFGSAQTMPVDDIEKQPVPSVHRWNDGEESFDVFLREVSNLARSGWLDDVHSVSLSGVGRDLDAFPHFRELAMDEFHPVVSIVFVKALFAAAILACSTSISASEMVESVPVTRPEPLPVVEAVRAIVASGLAAGRIPDTLHPPAATFSFDVAGHRHAAEVLAESVHGEDRVLRFRVAGATGDSMLTVNGGLMAGEISTPDGVFYLHPAANGHVMQPVQDFPCEVTSPPVGTAPAGSGTRRRRVVRHPRPEDFAEIGFMPTYTSRFIAARGGEAGAFLEFRNAVYALNDGLRATGDTRTAVVFRSAYLVDDSYLPVANASEALRKLWQDSAVQRARFEARAGVVMHFDIIDKGGGVAYILDDPEHPWSGHGLAVVDWRPGFSIPRTVQHEFGHAAFGLHHDKAHASPSACSYCLAWGSCEAALKDRMGSVPCWAEELPGYSGLARHHNGVRIGSEESDALRRILETRFVAANLWRYALE